MENGGGGEGVAEGERSEEFLAQKTQGSCTLLSQQGNSTVNQKSQWERFCKTWEPVCNFFGFQSLVFVLGSSVESLSCRRPRHQVGKMGRPYPSPQSFGEQ